MSWTCVCGKIEYKMGHLFLFLSKCCANIFNFSFMQPDLKIL